MARIGGIVVASLFGGVGNQLFCWAAGLALAERAGLCLVLECGSYERDPYGRTFALHRLGIRQSTKSYNYTERFAIRALARVSQARRGAFRVPGCTVLTEPGGVVNPALLKGKITGRCYLRGYWQSPRYFEAFRDRIRQAITLKPCADHLRSPDSVCVHIRSYKESQSQHLPREYYRAAYAECFRRLRNPHFVVYSDDFGWAKAHGMVPDAYQVGGTLHATACAAHDLCDLISMSSFQNFVIANSTFSWWAAYLAGKEAWVQAPAVARRCWFQSDPLPGDWHQL